MSEQRPDQDQRTDRHSRPKEKQVDDAASRGPESDIHLCSWRSLVFRDTGVKLPDTIEVPDTSPPLIKRVESDIRAQKNNEIRCHYLVICENEVDYEHHCPEAWNACVYKIARMNRRFRQKDPTVKVVPHLAHNLLRGRPFHLNSEQNGRCEMGKSYIESRLHRLEGLIQIGNQIFLVLDADRQPDAALIDAHSLPHFLAHRTVRRGG